MILTFTQPRIYLPKVTVASIFGPKNDLICKTLELPWLDNKQNKSCIPEDMYVWCKMPPGFGRDYVYFRCAYVKGRTMNTGINMSSILMHPADHVNDVSGCIGVGNRHVDFENDGVPDLAGSVDQLKWMADNMPDCFFLKITKKV